MKLTELFEEFKKKHVKGYKGDLTKMKDTLQREQDSFMKAFEDDLVEICETLDGLCDLFNAKRKVSPDAKSAIKSFLKGISAPGKVIRANAHEVSDGKLIVNRINAGWSLGPRRIVFEWKRYARKNKFEISYGAYNDIDDLSETSEINEYIELYGHLRGHCVESLKNEIAEFMEGKKCLQ